MDLNVRNLSHIFYMESLNIYYAKFRNNFDMIQRKTKFGSTPRHDEVFSVAFDPNLPPVFFMYSRYIIPSLLPPSLSPSSIFRFFLPPSFLSSCLLPSLPFFLLLFPYCASPRSHVPPSSSAKLLGFIIPW